MRAGRMPAISAAATPKEIFSFPQMTLAPDTQIPLDPEWSPGFVDYLFSGVQYQHRILAHGFPGSLPLGQGAHDDPIQHLAGHPGFAGGACGQYPLILAEPRQGCTHPILRTGKAKRPA